MSVLISCEVGGDRVPSQFITPSKKPNTSKRSRNQTHHADQPLLDEPAIYVARRMAERIDTPLIANEFSPDLIDVTRSLHNRKLFPPATRDWPAEDRQRLIDSIYHPYRHRVRDAIKTQLVRRSYVIHLSLRTFPLRNNGKLVRADMGLLYDPAIRKEVELCVDWIDEMYDELPMLKVRRNYPRRGTIDSITKTMRAEFSDQNYFGIELMLNRAWVGRPVAIRDELIDGICWSLQSITDTSHCEAA